METQEKRIKELESQIAQLNTSPDIITALVMLRYSGSSRVHLESHLKF